MKLVDLTKFMYMDSLIQKEYTGSPESFIKKLELSRSTFYDYLAYMRYELMLDIEYDSYRETYYYKDKTLCSALSGIRCKNCEAKGGGCKNAIRDDEN